MLMIFHLEFEEAAEIFKGFTIFNYWQKFGVVEIVESGKKIF